MLALPETFYWEIIADNLSKAGWSWDCVSAIDSNGRTIWIADAHLDNVGALLEEMLTTADLARVELHGPAAELEKLNAPLAHLNPAWFTLEASFSR